MLSEILEYMNQLLIVVCGYIVYFIVQGIHFITILYSLCRYEFVAQQILLSRAVHTGNTVLQWSLL